MSVPIVVLVMVVLLIIFLFNLVRSRRLKEKYVALWMLTGLAIVIMAIFPGILTWLTKVSGIQLTSNLLFTLAIVVLLGVCIQLSLEISRTEDKTRVLAENVAILNLQLSRLQAELDRRTDQATHTDQIMLDSAGTTAEAIPAPEPNKAIPETN